MDNHEEQKIWDLTVGQVNKSLDSDEQTEFNNLQNSKEAQKNLRIIKKIQLKVYQAFGLKEIKKEERWKYIQSNISDSNNIRKLVLTVSKYAAVFVIALSIGILVPKLFSDRNAFQANNMIEIEWGHMSKMTLSDGTQVWLNAGTTFEYPTTFNSKERLVSLNGEAQFKVSHSNDIPFEVQTESGVVKVYGTTFNVSSYEDDPDFVVTLVEGNVGVETINGDLLGTLSPSEQITINKKSGEAQIQEVNTQFYSSWIEGKILLENTTLSELSKILKRWYNVDITIQGEGTADIEISGTILKGKPLDLFLKILERMYGVQSELRINKDKRDELIIYKK